GLHVGLRLAGHVRWRGVGEKRRGGGHAELPAGRFWFFLLPGIDEGIGPPWGSELRRYGFDRRARMGAEKYRRIWRRSETRHYFRRIGRGRRCREFNDRAAGKGIIRARHR